jgi:hypothetical protein
MAVRFMRWLQGVPCEQFPVFDVDIATGAGSAQPPINHHRDDALAARERAHATCGGAISA